MNTGRLKAPVCTMTHNYNQPNAYGQEGVDHVNISSRSSSHLGKLLDPSYFKTVEYPHIGKFGSVMNLWYWLRSDPSSDVFRRATGDKLRKHLTLQKNDAYVPNFRAIIAHATYQKLLAYPGAIEEIKGLPESVKFISYYVPQGVPLRVCSNYANVIVPIVDMIRKAVILGQEPDFSKLLPDGTDVSDTYLALFLKKRFPNLRPATEVLES